MPCGSRRSSSSRNAIHGPRAAAMPAFAAADRPRPRRRSTNCNSRRPSRAVVTTLTSSPPSLTTITSTGRYVCAAMLASASARSLGRSFVRTTMDTSTPLRMASSIHESYVQTGLDAQAGCSNPVCTRKPMTRTPRQTSQLGGLKRGRHEMMSRSPITNSSSMRTGVAKPRATPHLARTKSRIGSQRG